MVELSEAEKRVICNWMDTDTGDKLLAIIKEIGEGYIEEAKLKLDKGPQFTHDRVVAAEAVETIYEWLKAYKKPDKPNEEE